MFTENEICILIVEDDKKICEELRIQLGLLEYKVYSVHSFEHIVDEFSQREYQLAILDLKLPYKNGFYWCRELRKISNVPIIILTSASDDINLISAINNGADDFVAKPFSMQVLDSKIKAILRRTLYFNNSFNKISYNGIVLDTDNMSLEYNHSTMTLSKNEYLIMELLLKNPKTVISRDKIMDKLWATDSFIDDNTLTVNINRIRSKLRQFGLQDLICTKKGVGYYIQ